jgi:hypothetical protein
LRNWNQLLATVTAERRLTAEENTASTGGMKSKRYAASTCQVKSMKTSDDKNNSKFKETVLRHYKTEEGRKCKNIIKRSYDSLNISLWTLPIV